VLKKGVVDDPQLLEFHGSFTNVDILGPVPKGNSAEGKRYELGTYFPTILLTKKLVLKLEW
jgi:hypothetical protein